MQQLAPIPLVIAMAIASIAGGAAESPLLGKPCPQLELTDTMLQGERITQADFAGKVVFIDLYQRGCPTCESNSMPLLQKFWEKHGANPSTVILAINTAFEKGQYPWMADEAGTQQHLKQQGWTMPVARDRDEKSVKLCGMGSSYGTPVALVLDAGGTVIAHDWNGTPEAAAKLEAAFEQALAEVDSGFVPPPRDVVKSLEPLAEMIRARKYGAAYKAASKALESKRASDEEKTDAAYLLELVKGAFARRTRAAERAFTYDPPVGLDEAEDAAKAFKGVGGDSELRDLIKQWRDSGKIAEFKALVAEFDTLRRDIKKLGKSPAAEAAAPVIERLRDLITRAEGTRIADEARQELAGLGAE